MFRNSDVGCGGGELCSTDGITSMLDHVLLRIVLLAEPRWMETHGMKKVLLVRHADIDVPPAVVDPPLNAAGQQRALELAHLLSTTGVTAILTSNLIRTKQTVAPLCARSGIQPQEAPPPTDLARLVRAGSFGDVVLIAGHSNTIPEMTEALGVPAPSPTIGEREFDNLFVVVLAERGGKGGMVRLRYGAGAA